MYKLYNGDCLEVMDKLIEEGVKVDCILTDPPYGTTACKWDTIIPFDKMWERLNKLIKPNGAIVLFGNEPFSSALRMSNIKKYKYDWKWDKLAGGGHLNAKHRPLQRTEDIIVFSNGKHLYYPQMTDVSDKEYKNRISKIGKRKTFEVENGIFGKFKMVDVNERDLTVYKKKYPSNILAYSKQMEECNNTKRVHPTQKPVAMMEYLIKTYTNENEIVLDFTMGSGSTGVACVNTNRKFIGIELDEKYFNISINRIFENYSIK